MKHLLIAGVLLGALTIAAFAGQTAQQPPPSADPYANNARPGATQFPLAENDDFFQSSCGMVSTSFLRIGHPQRTPGSQHPVSPTRYRAPRSGRLVISKHQRLRSHATCPWSTSGWR